jgi:phosphoribosylaminoimidazole carboxylase (NCAIR synthetase)
MNDGTVVIVDAYQPTRRLAPAFLDAGFRCVRVQSTRDFPAVYRKPFTADQFLANVVHDGDITRTAEQIALYNPVAVIPGGEIGVELADALSERLDVPTNGTAQSSARRDKVRMAETVRAAGLRAPRQIEVRNENALRRWHAQIGGRVVVKPARSSGGEGVHFCDTPEQSVAAYRVTAGTRNLFSQTNECILAQEYVAGIEYVVNAVSRDGRHHVCDMWRTSRLSRNDVLDLCDAVHLMPREGQAQDQLAAYAEQVLDALGIRHGPSHLEIKMTADGPCLIEAAARIPGADLPHYARLALGESQLDWIVDAYLRPERFLARCHHPYRLRRHFASVAMISPVDGELSGYRGLDEIDRLESLLEVRALVSPGDRIRRTVDDLTYPMIVNLMHEVEAYVLRDAATVRYLDGPAFYELAAASVAGRGCAW